MAAMKISWPIWIALAALLCIAAAVGVTQFEHYGHRAQASAAVSLLDRAKTPLAEYFQDQRKWPERLEQVVERTRGSHTQSIAISKGAGGTGEIELTATMRSEGLDQAVSGQTVRMLSADGGRTWVCRPGTMASEILPDTCRGAN